ncbi:hypothetical protein C496_02587 [Natronorubrum tibetense GA33]|uniref:Uncharacterized protein n=2 Tax=Natronorubrum tibetense TaxID=63128 RepID=L9WBV3_9EURY|nr:hypothetical protein C496_02587 [Natronorubrum tibetense GA33]
MLGSLMFMGFAGTAAADSHTNMPGDGDVNFGDQTSGDAINIAETTQENNNAQVGTAEATSQSSATAMGHDHDPKNHGGAAEAFSSSSADATVNQAQDVTQSNTAVTNQQAETGDNVQAAISAAFGDDFDDNNSSPSFLVGL